MDGALRIYDFSSNRSVRDLAGIRSVLLETLDSDLLGDMDSSRAFARRVLENLFLDLKRFQRGRAVELDALLGRSPQYFRRLTADRIRLDQAAVASRFVGLRLVERMRLLAGDGPGWGETVPEAAAGFFRRYRIQPTDRLVFRRLGELLDWGYGLEIRAGAEPLTLDLDARLASLGVRKPPGPLSLAYGNVMMDALLEARPATLPPESVGDLCRSVLRWTSTLPDGRSAWREAAALLDLAFFWERTLDDLPLRGRLFAEGARIGLALGHPADAVWCLRQAALLAALQADPHAFDSLRAEGRRILEDLLGDRPSERGPGEEGDLLHRGRADQIVLLRAVESDRALSSFPARELDEALGGRRPFTNALGGRVSIRLARWRRLVDQLDVPLEQVLDRAAVLDPVPPAVEDLLLGLKIAKPHRPLYPFQKPLLSWSKDVRLDAQAPRLGLRKEICDTAEREPAFSELVTALDELGRRLPDHLHPEDASRLGQGLLRACYLLRYRSYLDDAVDLLTVGLRLMDRAGSPAEIGMGFRSAAYLALDLGRIRFADLLVQRARESDLMTGSLSGFSLSLHAQSLIYRLAGDPRTSHQLTLSCILLSREGLCPLSIPSLQVFLANTRLELEDIEGARCLLDSAEPQISKESAAEQVEYLATRAETCSRLGQKSEATEIFDKASSLLIPETAARDLAVIGLAKCRHLIRYGLLDQARSECSGLLKLSSRLKTNPIGRSAIQEAVNRTLEGSIEERAFREFQKRLLFPNLRRKRP